MRKTTFVVLTMIVSLVLTAGSVGPAARVIASENVAEKQFQRIISIFDIDEQGDRRDVDCYYTNLTWDETAAAVKCRAGHCTLEERELWHAKVLYLEVYPGFAQNKAVSLSTALGNKAIMSSAGPFRVQIARRLILRVHLVGKWEYPVAVQAVFIPTDYNPPIQHGYKFATATSQRWVRFDFDLPQGGYKLFAYGGEAGKYSPYPYPVWAEAGPIPVRLDRDKDVTITLDP